MRARFFPAAVLVGLTSCIPAHTAAPPAPARYVVRVTTGEVQGLAVDWAIFPEEGWPLEGRRDRTPFQTELPPGRVAAMFRPTLSGEKLEIAIFLHRSDGSLKRVSRYSALPLAVVVLEPNAEQPSVLGSAEPLAIGAAR